MTDIDEIRDENIKNYFTKIGKIRWKLLSMRASKNLAKIAFELEDVAEEMRESADKMKSIEKLSGGKL